MSNAPDTNYVLDSISTFPTAIPLNDYSRKLALIDPDKRSPQKIAEDIKKWDYIQQKTGVDNEKITIYYNQNEWGFKER